MGCTAIWSALFTVGNFLYGRLTTGFLVLGVLLVSGIWLIFIVKKLWQDDGPAPEVERAH